MKTFRLFAIAAIATLGLGFTTSQPAFAQATQNNPAVNLAIITQQIDAAIAAKDNDLVASIVAQAVAQNPALASRLIGYSLSRNPAAAPAINQAVQSIASLTPHQKQAAFQQITQLLASNPQNQQILASVLSGTQPAAGNNRRNNNEFGGNRNRAHHDRNQEHHRDDHGPRENRNQTSPS